MVHPRRGHGAPTYGSSVYTTEAIIDPYPHYRRLRELGPVVWLSHHRVYALPRYRECKAVLRDDGAFTSTGGVALNPISNRLSRGTTLASDGAEHERRRRLVAHRMLPRALHAISDRVERLAGEVVDAALRRGEVDGAQLAAALPLGVVPDLVGWPADRREHLLHWAGATFDVLGPLNGRTVHAAPRGLHMLRFARQVVRRRDVIPGSMADELLAAADEGALAAKECPKLMVDYLGPALDTTIGAISNALYLFATHPDQWELLKADPERISNAINEIVRYESPLRAFGRRVAAETEIAGITLPKGSQVLVVYSSANRDESEWESPEAFDIGRDAGRHLGFGQGAHACAGQGLARLETGAFLRALIARVDRLEITGSPKWALNNIIRRHERLPLRLVAA
ncbi:cytochrome P450 [Mycobacterium bohemicum DSM 44277]|uniref:Monooxygenase n=2 Tax=Mycobacterium bohemicum TaxID=56425 RepID=A0A1X1QX89_MYCBE|nr:cytochrome P450 [Mycobacterium bohemicum]MCV6972608.1 cytochrome P450 [Mycobacterium bohemicum]ORU95992.1 monooxygenase [Mycobacterium bohemicum]CPR10706.1 cytochrome P450 [Mycobacterium bohemicum DSM 44277]